MTETWSLFTGNDLLIAVIGFIGVTSAVIVLMNAAWNVDTRERNLKNRVTEEEVES